MSKKPAKEKNIVLLSDGTGNSAAKIWKTNVWRLYKALDLADATQVAFYDDGVGTSSFKPLAALGGAVGYGLKRNVLDLYCFLCRAYDDERDRIYAFGFSRGAFTIRVVAAMIASEGLVPWNGSESELRRNAKAAYRAYRYRNKKWHHAAVIVLRLLRDSIIGLRNIVLRYEPYREVRKQVKEKKREPGIHFLGLWDTVDAYGLPLYEMTRAIHLFFWPLAFRNRDLSDKVERACHALSVDDERTTFHPLLWNEEGQKNAASIQDERLSQVWFTGVHSNVGGGYPDDALAHVPLKWIMDEAVRNGLQFKEVPDAPGELGSEADLRGRMYDSRHGLSGYFRYGPRRIEYLCNDTIEKVFVTRPKIHESVFERIEAGTGYAPIVLPANYAVVNAAGRILEGSANPYERPDLARWRNIAQEKVWNIVWLKRVSYFITLAATLYLAAFPCVYTNVCAPARKFFEPLFGWFPWLERAANWVVGAPEALFSTFTTSVGGERGAALRYLEPKVTEYVPKALDALATVLPGFASYWIDAFKASPGRFTFDLIIVILLTLWGSSLQNKIHEKMRKVWKPVMTGGPAKVPDEEVSIGWFAWLRTSWLYRRSILALRRTILPVLFALLYLYVIWWVLDAIWRAIVK